MNILFIGPYRQNDGWGQSAADYVKALATTEHKLAIRPIYMSMHIDKNFKDKQLLELENKCLDHYDVIIQKVLPSLFYYDRICKNIGLFTIETGNLQYTPWIRRINLLDQAWVYSNKECQDLKASGVKIPVYAIGGSIDNTKFQKEYPRIEAIKDSFNFYFIGEVADRKNLDALLTAFHKEFHPNENVNLVLKINQASREVLNKKIETLKAQLRIYLKPELYKREIIISDHLPSEALYGLHQSCHCIVMPSCGEAFCRPVMDALGFGKPAIVTDNTGMNDYVGKDVGWVIPSRIEPVRVEQSPLQYLYTGHETWSSIDILKLAKAMREAYTNKTLYEQKSKSAPKVAKLFDHGHIGANMNKWLNEI
jgi:glycosyltransferase involved in cell wall biosynthesis